MNLKEMLAAKQAEAAELVRQKNDGEIEAAAFIERGTALKAEIADIEGKIAAAKAESDLLKSFSTGGVKTDEVNDGKKETPRAFSLGDHFVKSGVVNAAKRAKEEAGRFAVSAPEYKAVGAILRDSGPTSGLGMVQYGRVVPVNFHRPVVADLLGSGQVEQPTLQYFVQNTPTDASTLSAGSSGNAAGGFAAVTEAGLKPELGWGFGTATETLKKIAGWYQISDEALEDLPYITSVIDSQLLLRLALEEERQLVNGSGSNGELLGLLNRSGITSTTAATGAQGNAEAIFAAMTQITTDTGLAADGIILNPADFQRIRLGKDANNQYFGGGYFLGEYGDGGTASNGVFAGSPNIWGLNTVVTPGIPAGTALVANFSLAAQVLRKGGVRVDSTNTDQDDFVRNLMKVRAEERLMMALYYPKAVVKLTLA